MEKQVMGTLSFLCILLENSGISINISTFHKNIYTSLLYNYFSFTSFFYKIDLIKALYEPLKLTYIEFIFMKTPNRLNLPFKRIPFKNLIDKILIIQDTRIIEISNTVIITLKLHNNY